MLGIFRSLIAVIILAIAAPASVAQERGGRDSDRTNAHEDTRQRAGEHQNGQDQNAHQQNAPGVLALLPGEIGRAHV